MDFSKRIGKLKKEAIFELDGYYVWCGTMIRDNDGLYYFYFSFWEKKLGFNAWATHSKVGFAVGKDPFGKLEYGGIALDGRGHGYWDGDCIHNPSVIRVDGKYYMYYMGNYGNKQAVMPAADEMQSIFRYFKANGFDGSGTQMESFNLWNNLLNFYCFGRMAYDTDLSLEQAIGQLSRLFGAGAEEVAEIWRIYEDTLDGQVSIDHTGKLFAQIVDAEKIYDLFEKAFAKGENALYRNNIRMLRMAFRYTMLIRDDSSEAEQEKGVMATFFDSFHHNDPGFGIAIVSDVHVEQLPDDKWYRFEA